MEGDVSGSAAANLDVNAEAAADMHAELAAEAEATADAYGYGVGCDELEGAAAVSVASQHRMVSLFSQRSDESCSGWWVDSITRIQYSRISSN